MLLFLWFAALKFPACLLVSILVFVSNRMSTLFEPTKFLDKYRNNRGTSTYSLGELVLYSIEPDEIFIPSFSLLKVYGCWYLAVWCHVCWTIFHSHCEHHSACVVTVVVLDWLLSCRQSGKSNSIICLVSCFLSLSFSLWRAQRCLLPWCTFSCAQRCVCMLSMCICHLSPLPLRTITGGGVLWSYQALPVTMCWYTL